MIRKIARPMLASVFVYDGVDSFRNTSDHVADTESFLSGARKVLPSNVAGYIPNDPEFVTQALGGVKVGSGALLGLGKAPRTNAVVLALATLPNLLGRGAFWDAKDSEEKKQRRNGFITNTALLGALFITSQDTEGKPSLTWRAKKAGERTNKKIHQALPTKSESQKFAENVSERASEFSSKASDWFEDATNKAQAYVEDNKDDWESAGRGLLDKAKSYVEDAKSFVEDNKDDWLSDAKNNAKLARKGAVKAANKAKERAAQQAEKLEGTDAKRAAKKARKKLEKLQDEANKKLEKAFEKYGDR